MLTGTRKQPGLSAHRAATALSYVDVNETGSFFLKADGTHEPVVYADDELLPGNLKWVPYSRLECFFGPDGGERWHKRARPSMLSTLRPVQVAGMIQGKFNVQL